MATEIRGGKILKEVKERLTPYKEDYNQKQVAIIRFNPPVKEKDPTQLSKYEAARFSTEHKVKTFDFLGAQVYHPVLDSSISPGEFSKLMRTLNEDPKTVGIIVQNPYPESVAPTIKKITLEKDIDGMRKDNPIFRTSATSETIFRLVKSFAQENDTVAVVGAEGFVGAGVAKLLKEAGIKTIELDKGDDLLQTREANIVVSATGKANLLGEQNITPEHRLVVDAGFVPQKGEDNPPLGDVSRSAYDIPQNITPVPGGVGPLQMATLMERLVTTTSGKELERWTVQTPEISPSIQGDQLTPSNIETIFDVANRLLRDYGEELDNSARYIDDDYIIEKTDEKLTITAQDGRGTILTELDDKIYCSLEPSDIEAFESFEQEFFPSRYKREIELEDEGWEL